MEGACRQDVWTMAWGEASPRHKESPTEGVRHVNNKGKIHPECWMSVHRGTTCKGQARHVMTSACHDMDNDGVDMDSGLGTYGTQ